ncbi:alpha-farnesene synthase-like [Chenopodium quinoa]|uniref:alpha-farnesene synthase-like n=1 Tax=Chenopodium quinoa TaxID=63459 RepID=UPI000B79ABE3|nr:alpha-farnesene synthase-like [Chenopodium quinoa]
MNNTNYTQNQLNQPNHEMKSDSCGITHERRSANYKPNIWSYDFVQSLTSEFTERKYRERAEKLKVQVMHMLSEAPELSKPHIVETIRKLGLSNALHMEIMDTLDSMVSNLNNNNNNACFEQNILGTSLSFRLLRQHGYNVSQEMFVDFISEVDFFKENSSSKFDIRGILELYEACYLAVDGEELMEKAKAFSQKYLTDNYFDMDVNLAKQVAFASEIPCHRKVLWFDVTRQIRVYELKDNKNLILLELAKLNFNIVQAMHLEDLKEMSRWWKNLGLIENISFTRDRLVESFLWTVGVACEPQHSLLRKCLTKVVTFVLVLDDAYDIYGSLEELECFTRIVERWDYEEVEQLPECMKVCFKALVTTTYEIATDIQKAKGWNDISPFLKSSWADFCKALLREAWWYKKRYIPSLDDYLNSAWISSSGPLLSLIALLCTADCTSEELNDKWDDSQDLIYYSSLIIRLLNDQGTSAVKGDAHSSIMCYMVDAGVTEEIAREHMKDIIDSAWSKINMELLSATSKQQTFVNLVINTARVCHFIYKKGDGFSVQDGDTKNKIKRLLIEPLKL